MSLVGTNENHTDGMPRHCSTAAPGQRGSVVAFTSTVAPYGSSLTGTAPALVSLPGGEITVRLNEAVPEAPSAPPRAK